MRKKRRKAVEKAEKLKEESKDVNKEDLVDIQGFALMLADREPPQTAENGVPRKLAQELIDELFISSAYDETDLSIQNEFNAFRAFVDGEEKVPLFLPGSDKPIPVSLLLSLLTPKGEEWRVPPALTMHLLQNWDVETVEKSVRAIKIREKDINAKERKRKEKIRRTYKNQQNLYKKDRPTLAELKAEKEAKETQKEHKKDRAKAKAREEIRAKQREIKEKMKQIKNKGQDKQEEQKRENILKLKGREDIHYVNGKSVSRLLGKPLVRRSRRKDRRKEAEYPDFFLSVVDLL